MKDLLTTLEGEFMKEWLEGNFNPSLSTKELEIIGHWWVLKLRSAFNRIVEECASKVEGKEAIYDEGSSLLK